MKRKASVEKVKVGSVEVRIYARTRETANGERTVYELADYSTGVRRLRGFSDRDEAHREAKRIASQLSTGNAEAARMQSHEAASYARAMELKSETGDTLETVCDRYAQIWKLLGGDGSRAVEAVGDYVRRNPVSPSTKTVAEVATELQAKLAADKVSNRYLDDLKFRLGRFSESFQTTIGSISGGEIQKWLNGLDCAKQSRLNFKRVVGRLFTFAKSHGYVVENPTKELERIKVKTSAAIAIFTPEELAKLLKAAPADFLPPLAISAFAGLRSAEVARLDWSNVKLAEGHIEVSAKMAKTASRRLVPILPCLAAWLQTYAKSKGRVWPMSERRLYLRQTDTAAKVGIEWKHNALRHSFISYRLADTQDAARVSLEAGNSPQMIFRHYREVVTAKAATAYFGILPDAPANVVQLKSA